MRVIELGTDYEVAQRRFSIISTCAYQGKPPAGLEGFRTLTKLQDAIEAVSADGETFATRKLNEGVTELVLNDAPYNLLKDRFFGAEIDWLTVAARRVTEAYDAVCEATEVTPADVAKPAERKLKAAK